MHRRVLHLLLPACLAAWMVAGAAAGLPREVAAQSPRRGGQNNPPFRVGMVLAHPRVCAGQEPTQKDLRLLRLGYGLDGNLTEMANRPWFFGPGSPPGGEGIGPPPLAPENLWGEAPPPGRSPDFPPSLQPEELAPWRAALAAAFPALGAARPAVDGQQFSGPAGAPPLFQASRLWSTRALPFRAALPEGQQGCRDWPRGVAWHPGRNGRPARVVITNRPTWPAGRDVTLTLYPTEKALWDALLEERLDVALLEGGEITSAAGQAGLRYLPAAAVPGSQQIVVRLRGSLSARLGAAGRLALSRASDRNTLARAAGPGFAPAERFLQPLLPPGPRDRAHPLAWDSRQARRAWMAQPLFPQHITLAVLAHPLLETLATVVAGQWQKTLNLAVTVTVFPVDQFAAALEGLDAALDVGDLEDGSLQAWWEGGLAGEAPPPGGALPPETLERWEGRLAAEVPLLPLLGNRHLFLARGPGAARTLAAFCHGCPTASLVQWAEPRRR